MSVSAREQLDRPTSHYRTVLEQKIRERRLTLEEFVEFAEVFAREHGERGTLSLRHLKRLVAARGENGAPLGPLRPATARLLEKIFGLAVDDLLKPPEESAGGQVEAGRASVARPVGRSREVERAQPAVALASAFEWLDKRAGWIPDTARRKVSARAAKLDTGNTLDRRARRARVDRGQVARALLNYYGDRLPGHDPYRVRCDGRLMSMSVVTRRGWLDVASPLDAEHERLELVSTEHGGEVLDDIGARRAVDRLAEAVALGVRVTDSQVYRLLEVGVEHGSLSGALGVAPFIEYALTADLLEGELVDALATVGEARRDELPLRGRYLPDLKSVFDVSGRLCAGGALALCAVARPTDPYRGKADYAILVQERSGSVLNSAGRLSVIPKAFHQPLKDVRADVSIRSTLLREMEEELFGRSEVDSTLGGQRAAAPMHPHRLSEPMRWLMEEPDRLRIECTGFGLNLVSGNYEFAGLIVIEDEEFWPLYGGHVEANWESAGLRVYSSLDRELTNQTITDETWSNEGLFALLQGFRRLAEIGGERVNLPVVELDAESCR
ncbi:transcriptional regulator [Amycolatopsis taiwanensis]|uniref:transcriptional regulator n=1 Tax=Amycolatopsis taiwanensis TaxID=342230 RepID=UPI0004BACA0C|nr:transcriptional regulator [Amycolatopsis taiwanensis]